MAYEITGESLHHAVSCGQSEMVQKLLSPKYASVMGFRADKPSVTGSRNTPIHNAAYGKNLKILKLLYNSLPERDRAAALNARQANGWTPLFEAVFIPRPPSDFAAGERDESGAIVKKRTQTEVEKYQKWYDKAIVQMPSVVTWLLNRGAASFDARAILEWDKSGNPIGPTPTVFEYIDRQLSFRVPTEREVVALKACHQMILEKSGKDKPTRNRVSVGKLKPRNEK